jgi:hypothetical protein
MTLESPLEEALRGRIRVAGVGAVAELARQPVVI